MGMAAVLGLPAYLIPCTLSHERVACAAWPWCRRRWPLDPIAHSRLLLLEQPWQHGEGGLPAQAWGHGVRVPTRVGRLGSWAGTHLLELHRPSVSRPWLSTPCMGAVLPVPPYRDGDDTLDLEDLDEMEGGDLDALAADNFAGLPQQAFPWAGPPVEAPPGAGEGGADGAGGSGSSSRSESSDGSSSSDGSEGGGSSSGCGSEGEAMDEDEEDEWFPGGDAGAY